MNGKFALLLCGILVAGMGASPAQASCSTSRGAVLQILGSGGPFGHGRASSGYLIWMDGVARVLIDAGGGTFTRFHESGARIADLELIAISHFHPDHSAEVPALLWIKPTNLRFSGPSGSDLFPSAEEYVAGLFGPDGVYRAVTNGEGLDTVTVDIDRDEATVVWADESLQVTAIGVPHGIVPAVGYRIDTSEGSVVFASDQNGSSELFSEFAYAADILVAHLAIPEDQAGAGARLHARPSVWGQMATDLDAAMLVLAHLSGQPPTEASAESPALFERLALVRSRYDGDIVVAEDLLCIPLGDASRER